MEYKPPSGVRAEAGRALKWIEEGHAGGGFTDVGRKRASDLARGAAVSRDTIGRIANYLARHEGDKKGQGWNAGEEGYPSAGRVAWAAWGGDPAKTWTAGIISSEEKSAREGCECWDGYCRVPGTEPCSPGSCEKCDASRAEEQEEQEEQQALSGRSTAWNGVTMTALKNRERILDVREERSGATPLEFREDRTTGQVILRGYAATYEPYDCYGGPDNGGWVEQLRGNSFDKTLGANPDVMLLLNHTGAPLARTKSGTMKLSSDRRGLMVEAQLDPTDPDVQALLPKMRRGDLDEMSFAFRVTQQEWNDDYTHRTINEVSLQKGDVSVVNYGMNPNTRVRLSEDTVGALAQLSKDQLVELRRLDSDTVERAIANLNRLKAESRACDQEKEEEMDRSSGGNPFAEDDEDEDDEEEKAKRAAMTDPGESDEEEEDEEDGEKEAERELQLIGAAAAALDKTITHAYMLAEGNEEVQSVLKQARNQLGKIRGTDTDGNTEVERKLQEFRKECGLPDTGSIEDGFAYLRSQSTDPMGLGHRSVLAEAEEAEREVAAREQRLAAEKLVAERALYESLGYIPKPSFDQ